VAVQRTRSFNAVVDELTRDELLELQWRKVQHQLQFLYARNAFYRQRLDEVGVRPDGVRSMAEFRERVPICGKLDLLADQSEHPPYGSRLGVDDRRVVMTYTTSGTSGVGQEVYGHTWQDALLSGTKYLEGPLHLAGLRPGDRVFAMTPIVMLAFGLMVAETMRLASFNEFEVFGLDSAAKLAAMKRFGVEAMVVTPAHLARLSTICKETGLDPKVDFPDLKAIMVAGQSYPLELARSLEAFWGTKLYETYGSSQGLGHVGATCERGAVVDGERGCIHIFEHHELLEVLDPDTGEHVAPGEVGVGVITNLDVEGSPLLRFRTDDRMVWLGATCPCGRPHGAIEAGTMDRYDDMIKVRGMNVWPQTIDGLLFGAGVEEYVAEVSVDDADLEQVDIRLAFTAERRAALDTAERAATVARLVEEIKAKTNVTMRLREVDRSELPAFEFKAVRWSDRRQADLARKVW
jgi:phenylacetate-CoA ligase